MHQGLQWQLYETRLLSLLKVDYVRRSSGGKEFFSIWEDKAMFGKKWIVGLAVVFVLLYGSSAPGDAILWGPTPYLSEAYIPDGFYAGGTPTFLD